MWYMCHAVGLSTSRYLAKMVEQNLSEGWLEGYFSFLGDLCELCEKN